MYIDLHIKMELTKAQTLTPSLVSICHEFEIQFNLNLVTLNLVATCGLVTNLQRTFFNLIHKIIRFSDNFCH